MTRALPDILVRIAEAAGEDAALLVAREWGGRRLHLPQKLRPGHRLIEVLGRARAQRVLDELGFGTIVVPLGPEADGLAKRRLIRKLLEEGVSHDAIAVRVRVHVRTVERESQRRRQDAALPLFDGPQCKDR